MSPITHFLLGWSVANVAPTLNKRERAWVTLAGVAPDLDGLGLIGDWATRHSAQPLTWWSDYHHVLAHNLGFALLLTVSSLAFAQRRIATALLVCLSFHLHLLGDLAGARGPDGDPWPIPYLMPFSRLPEWTWAGQWELNAWPNVVITGSLILLSLALARSRGFSPLEIFSAKVDRLVVDALQRRFPGAPRPEVGVSRSGF